MWGEGIEWDGWRIGLARAGEGGWQKPCPGAACINSATRPAQANTREQIAAHASAWRMLPLPDDC